MKMTTAIHLSSKLNALLGPKGWLNDPTDVSRFCSDWAGRERATPIGVACPATTQDVSAVVTACNEHGIAIIPQGGRTGLVLGNIPHSENSIILSLRRMNRISPIIAGDFCVETEAGAILGDLHTTLEDTELMFPVHLGSEGSAQIGGLISTNAGGNMAFRFGMMQDQVLGLEVVLPDGRIWDGVRSLIKDNAGFHLRRLFCGSEGRLGIITRATLRLHVAPRNRATAFLAFSDTQAALNFSTHVRLKLGEIVTGMEFITDTVMGMTLSQIPELIFPLEARADTYLLIELSSAVDSLDLTELLENAFVRGYENQQVLDGVIAQNEAQREALWRLREELPEGQKRDGAQLKHDVSVPVSRIAEFLQTTDAKAKSLNPNLKICAFGHMGDGNIHYNYSSAHAGSTIADASALSRLVYDQIAQFGGSFAAEHGLGHKKTNLADDERSSVERDLMRSLRQALNPENLMNPDVVIN